MSCTIFVTISMIVFLSGTVLLFPILTFSGAFLVGKIPLLFGFVAAA